jgi:hypothetical protein
MYASGKPFCVLMPCESIFFVQLSKLFTQYGITLFVLHPRPKFLHKGEEVRPTSVGYFCGNIDGIPSGMVSVRYLNTITGEVTGDGGGVEVDLEDELSCY